MTAFEGNRIDHPHIPLVAHGIDHAVGDLAMRTRPVDGLCLGLAGNGLAVFIASIHTALEPFSRGRCNRLRDCLGVKEILPAFGQQENMLIAAGTAILAALRHGIFLHPDDVVSQIPTAVPEGKGQHPRNADHILRLAALNLVVESHSLTVPALGILGVNEITLIAFPGIGVGNVEPECSVRTQNAPDFGKHFGQARDIFLRCCLSADLFLHAVVAQRVVRRGCDAAMDALVGQGFQDFETVTNVDCVKLYGDHSFR